MIPPMNELGNKYALAALRERRAELAGEIAQAERRLAYLREMVAHVDATIRLFDPEADPDTIPRKKPYKRVKLFGAGKLNRLILDTLREAGRPMTTQEVIAAIVTRLGYGEDAGKAMSHRVRANLAYLVRSRPEEVRKEGERAGARWTLTNAQ